MEFDTTLIANQLERCRNYAKGKLLDIGCGSKPYKRIFSTVDCYIGVDLSENSKADVIGNAMKLPFASETFDTVLTTQVLEHVPEPSRMIEEMYRVMRPDGYLILTAPQTGQLHGEPHDYYRFTKHGLCYLLEKNGFIVDYIKARGGFWITVGNMFVVYISSFRPILNAIMRPVAIIVQIMAPLLDLLRFWELDTLGYLVIARKPGNR